MEKLLLENLDSIQYEQFIKAFPLYNTYEEAKAKGFIAHHIFPVCLQNKDRKDPELDDRCVRLTPFEHIVAHYLLAKENEDPKLKYSFFCMCYTESSKISKEEKLSLETLHECASPNGEIFGEPALPTKRGLGKSRVKKKDERD